jgi:hypothetical protein
MNFKTLSPIYLLLQFAAIVPANGQILNYNFKGHKIKATSEEIVLAIHKNTSQKVRAPLTQISLPGILGNTVGLVVNAAKYVLSAEEEKYTATYTSISSENGLIYDSLQNGSSSELNILSIDIYRITVNKDFSRDTATKIKLSPDIAEDGGLFRFKVTSLDMPYSKAKIKKWGKRGKNLAINITIKLDALWKESINSSKSVEDVKGKNPDSIQKSGYQIKTMSLGESSILLPVIIPTKNAYLERNYYSGWFQFPPSTVLQFANRQNHYSVGHYSVTITVKEANPYGIDSKQMAAFMTATSSDISNVIKGLIPNSTK